VRFALVDLPELLLVVDLDANAVLEHVLDVLLDRYLSPVSCLLLNQLLEVGGVTPRNLNGRRSLSHVRKDSFIEWILVDRGLVLLLNLFVDVFFVVFVRYRLEPRRVFSGVVV